MKTLLKTTFALAAVALTTVAFPVFAASVPAELPGPDGQPMNVYLPDGTAADKPVS